MSATVPKDTLPVLGISKAKIEFVTDINKIEIPKWIYKISTQDLRELVLNKELVLYSPDREYPVIIEITLDFLGDV